MDPLDESLARRALRKAAMTDRPVADREPLSDSALGHWRRELQHRTVDPSLPWPDHEVMVLVARFLATLDAARAHPDEAGLREALERLIAATDRERIGGLRYVFEDELIAARASLAQPAVPVAGAEDDDTPFPADAIYDALHDPDVFATEASEGNIGRSVIVMAFRQALRAQGFEVVSALRAAQPEDDVLDVERLARATARVVGSEAMGWHREWAAKVAAEYARLSESSEGVERRDP